MNITKLFTGHNAPSLRSFQVVAFLFVALLVNAQTPVTITVNVSAVTGQSVAGLKVNLSNDVYGIEYQPVTLTETGTAQFRDVLTGVNTLSIDGTSLGLENYKNDNLNVSTDVTTFSVVLNENTRTPYNLTAELIHDSFTGQNNVALGWNRETDYFFDDFEDYEPFAIKFDPWTGYDGDKEAAAVIQGSYENAGLPQYATIFNCLTIDPPLYYDYPVMRPYSGKQYVGFIRTSSGNANNDWLISPKIKVGVDNVVNFMAKAADVTKERFNVLVSTGSTDISDFVSLTSGNYQTVDYKYWVPITYSLADYEGQEVYIAIQCVSTGAFMLMVDDFYVGPASNLTSESALVSRRAHRVGQRSEANPYEQFNIYVDNNKVGSTDSYNYTIENIAAGTHEIAVEAAYQVTTSAKATISVDVPSADSYHSLSATVKNTLGTPLSASVTAVGLTSGEAVSVNTDEKGEARIVSLPNGEYLVNVHVDGYNDHSENVTIDKAVSLDVVLTEDISDPYNVTFDNDSKTLTWNQDLGFTDGFEDYTDFSQTFGDWTVIDGDQMPTYAIGIGASLTLLTTPETRGTVGAMIFNPDKTQPLTASDDALFVAPEGEKYVMFNSAEQSTSDDWMISPLQAIGEGYVARFTAKSYSSAYPGRFELGVMSDVNDTSTFEELDVIDLTSDWSRYELSLAAYANTTKAFAFHHTSSDQWISFIDDVYIGPAEITSGESSANATYNIYVDGTLVATVANCEYQFTNLSEGIHTIGVQAVYLTGTSKTVNVTVDVAGITTVTVDDADAATTYYNAQGMKVAANQPGIYIARTGTQVHKVLVK
jgi:hypothetical protein